MKPSENLTSKEIHKSRQFPSLLHNRTAKNQVQEEVSFPFDFSPQICANLICCSTTFTRSKPENLNSHAHRDYPQGQSQDNAEWTMHVQIQINNSNPSAQCSLERIQKGHARSDVDCNFTTETVQRLDIRAVHHYQRRPYRTYKLSKPSSCSAAGRKPSQKCILRFTNTSAHAIFVQQMLPQRLSYKSQVGIGRLRAALTRGKITHENPRKHEVHITLRLTGVGYLHDACF